MKKLLLLTVTIVISLSLVACSSLGSSNTYTVTMKDTVFTVDTGNGTVFDGVHTYDYSVSGDSSKYRIEVIYPDGSIYWQQMSGGAGTGGWSDDYDRERYVDGNTLCFVLKSAVPKSRTFPLITVGLFIIVGLINVAFPQAAWYCSYGWRYRDAEPSEVALLVCRGTGVLALVIGIVMIFI